MVTPLPVDLKLQKRRSPWSLVNSQSTYSGQTCQDASACPWSQRVVAPVVWMSSRSSDTIRVMSLHMGIGGPSMRLTASS